jgi:hypothetical protein
MEEMTTRKVYYYYGEELYHHGIQGQKWGVRRYQNEDGTLTDKGKKRYGKNLNIKDTSYTNIAKIRLGKARENLDTAISENADRYEIKALKGRVREAKKALRKGKSADKGQSRYNSGETITENNMKSAIGIGAAFIGRKLFSRGVLEYARHLSEKGTLDAGKFKALQILDGAGRITLTALGIGYAAKKAIDSKNIRRYYSTTKTETGSKEYQQVKKEHY